MKIYRCPTCGDIILISFDSEDREELEIKMEAHTRKHQELEDMLKR